MVRRIAALAVAVALVTVGGACTGEPRETVEPRATVGAGPAPTASTAPTAAAASGTGPDRDGTVSCAHVIGTSDQPAAHYETFLDAVALPTRTVLEPVRMPDGTYWAKQGLEVRAGVEVEIAIDPGATGRATIQWGSPGKPSAVQRVPACPPSGAGEWLAFAGGFTVREPSCVRLIVKARGRAARAEVRVGAPCP